MTARLLLLQEELAFPYRQGMQFIKDLLVAGGKQLAYTGVLARMPQTTREIMEPKEYLAGHRVPPLLLPDLGFLKKDYEPYDAGAVGQLDVSLLLRIYADETLDKRLSPEWRGGAYYAAGRREPNRQTATLPRTSACFMFPSGRRKPQRRSLPKHTRTRCLNDMNRCGALLTMATCPGLAQYTSSDGPIFIQQTGNAVVAVESFDEEAARKLIEAGLKQAEK